MYLTQIGRWIVKLTDLREALSLDAHQLAQDAHLSQEQAAEVCGMKGRAGWLRKVNPADLPHFHPDEIVALAKATGDCRMLDRMEDACGRVGLRLPEAEQGSADVQQRLLGLTRSLGQVAELFVTRALTPSTLEVFDAALVSLVREAMGLRELLRRTVEAQR